MECLQLVYTESWPIRFRHLLPAKAILQLLEFACPINGGIRLPVFPTLSSCIAIEIVSRDRRQRATYGSSLAMELSNQTVIENNDDVKVHVRPSLITHSASYSEAVYRDTKEEKELVN